MLVLDCRGFLLRNVVESASALPVIIGRSSGVTEVVSQNLVSFHPVHHIEVTHFVCAGEPEYRLVVSTGKVP